MRQNLPKYWRIRHVKMIYNEVVSRWSKRHMDKYIECSFIVSLSLISKMAIIEFHDGAQEKYIHEWSRRSVAVEIVVAERSD